MTENNELPKRFAFVADGDVFYTIYLDPKHEVAAKWIAAGRSGVSMISTPDYGNIPTGSILKNGNFYNPSDSNFKNPLPKEEPYPGLYRYTGIIDNEVVGMITFVEFEMGIEMMQMIAAGMSSNPQLVEIPDELMAEVNIGWTYDGTTFSN